MTTRLVRIVIVMRHGARTPILNIRPYALHFQTHNPFWRGQLTSSGKKLCRQMGAWMRSYLTENGFRQQSRVTVRIMANGLPRTVASAEAFANGLLKGHEVQIETGTEVSKLFTPRLKNINADFLLRAEQEAAQKADRAGIMHIPEELVREFSVLAQLMAAREDPKHRKTGLLLEEGSGPRLEGLLNTAAQISDSLLCRDLMQPRLTKPLTQQARQALAGICDERRDILFGTRSIVQNACAALLLQLHKELNDGTELCTLMCGHDSTIKAVLTALEAEPYFLLDSSLGEVPPGCCLCFEVYEVEKKDRLVHVHLLYPRDAQLMGTERLNQTHPPASQEMHFANLSCKENGLYQLEELTGRLLHPEEGCSKEDGSGKSSFSIQ